MGRGFVSQNLRRGGWALILEEMKLLERPVIGAGEGGFVAEEHLKTAAVVGEVVERPG
jgi:hypothetical protein